jgi:hypothetical protein
MSGLDGASRRKQIKKLRRRDETIVRMDVVASIFPMTWGADGDQLVVFTDGADLNNPPTRAYHSCIFRIAGDPPAPVVEELPGFPHMPMRFRESEYASFWGGSCLSVDGCVYHFLSTSNRPYLLPDGEFAPGFFQESAKLIYSPDGGRTWRNQDGSSPVVWDNWVDVSAQNMAFYKVQPEGAFAIPTFLQMGRDYELNRDGYVYVYSGNGGEDGSANQLVMFRAPKDRVADRSTYEFFAGMAPDGAANWTREISLRAPVHTFPLGWVSGKMPGAQPSGWWTAAAYNPALDLYMLVAQGTGQGVTGGWFGKPSYLGVWVSQTPWGPFEQVHEEEEWLPQNDPYSRGFAPQIPPKWIAPDGESFWLVWTDVGSKGGGPTEEFNPDRQLHRRLRNAASDEEFARGLREWNREHQLNSYLNMQRVDILLE